MLTSATVPSRQRCVTDRAAYSLGRSQARAHGFWPTAMKLHGLLLICQHQRDRRLSCPFGFVATCRW